MIVWINGTFGVGKSSTAAALHEMWPEAILFDPEVLGVGLRMWTPPDALVWDFQDLELWRHLTVELIQGLVTEWGRPVIVPMTVLRPIYFDEIIGRLRAEGADVRHFCLTAPPDVLHARAFQRSLNRGEGGNMTWIEERWAQYDPSDTIFSEHLDTTTGTAVDMAALIVARLGNPLPSTAGPSRWTSWRRP